MTGTAEVRCRPDEGPVRAAGAMGMAALAAVAGLAWWRTVTNAGRMAPMVDGIAGVGRPMSFDVGSFVPMWAWMMAAMMLPSLVAHLAFRPGLLRWSPIETLASATAYVAVWVSTAVVALAVLHGLGHMSRPSAGLERLGGLAIALAGMYQWSGWKRRLLGRVARAAGEECRPLHRGALRSGLRHGLYCLACSGPMMATLLVVGVMNLVWMLAIAAVCSAEKTRLCQQVVARPAGACLLALGAAIVVHPSALLVLANVTL